MSPSRVAPLLIGLALLSSATAAPLSLDALLTDDQLWQHPSEQFMERYGALGFEWTSREQKSARLYHPTTTLYDQPVGETLVYFHDDRPHRVQISLYNRGDDQSVGREEFAALYQSWKSTLQRAWSASGEERKNNRQSAVKTTGWIWRLPPRAALLEFSERPARKSRGTPYSAEFLRLRLAPYRRQSLLEEKRAQEKKRATARNQLPQRVEKRSNGDVLIPSIPMVDQGPKGYCVCATAERVFRYYGLEVDQHEMAQIADSSATGGTALPNMIAALKKISGRFHVRTRTMIDLDLRTLTRIVTRYNRAARRRDAPTLLEVPREGIISSAHWYEQFEGDTLLEAVTRNPAERNRFLRHVERAIDAGIPLLWSVYLGIYPEEGISLQSRGGHMRLIIGYNSRTGEILYSDSWGAGHAEKRLGQDEAFAMTKGLHLLQPAK